jgi:fructan beta-fructosidase
MKQNLFLVFLLLVAIVAFPKKKDEVKVYDEIYRAQFHYSPAVNRMGNPISVWIEDSTYQMVYQYNPHNFMNAYVNWGLATSTDLLKWDQQDIVITQPETETDSMEQVPWSGSVVSKEGELHAWVNRWNDGIYSVKRKDGSTWENEVETAGTEKLSKSESYVFWHQASQKWVMVAFERESTTMYIHNSNDGINWEQTSSFNYLFGFPQFFEMPVDRKQDDTRWVLATENGTYMLGEFDGKVFNLTSSVLRSNHSKEVGSTVFFNDVEGERTLAVSGMIGDQLADMPANGQLCFPVEVYLHQFENSVELLQKPIDEIVKLYTKSYLFEDKKIYPGIKNNILSKLKGKAFHFKGTIDILNCDKFGFLIRSGRDDIGVDITYNVKKSMLSFLQTNFEYKPENNKMEIEIIVDRSSIELFIDGGRYVVSYPFAPKPESLKYELFTMGGEILVENLEVYELKSVWRED